MDPELWKKAQEFFHRALPLEGAARQAFLDDACAGDARLREAIERMLTADASAPSWLDGNAGEAAGLFPSRTDDALPERLGPYRIVGLLGTGGMGTVYEGVRDDDFSMRVALKSLRPGPAGADLLRRFHRERQILANLQHPAIARLLDGGETSNGRPWFAMEYVEGVPIDAWCDQRRLDVDGRIRLFLQVCRAVQYAHLNLVLHRDLKPSNILVTEEGEPKLLDFGIARILDVDGDPGLTHVGARQPLTPEYASPEQFTDEPLTTASDVYQLGILLYRLLTGRAPHDEASGSGEWARVRSGGPPTWPSATALRPPTAHRGEAAGASVEDLAGRRGVSPERLARRLRGDLDTIVLEALRPEPEERYASAEALADDLERHLEGRPVRARRPSLGYSLGRFVRRNRVAVGASALALAGILAGAGAAVVQARRASLERDTAEEVSAFLEDLLTAPDPFQGGLGPADSVRMVDFIDYADERIRNGLTDRPATRARMLTLLGRVQGNLGRWDQALPTLREAVDANREHFGLRSPETVTALRSLGFGLSQTGAAEEGDSILRQALKGQMALTGERSLETAAIQELVARGLLDARRLDEAEPLLRSAYETRLELLGEADPAVAGTLNGLAALYAMRGDREASVDAMEEAVAIMERVGGEERANLGIMLGNLAGAYRDLGRLDEADKAATRGLAILEDLLGPDHFLTAGAQGQLAALRAARGQAEEADSLWGGAVAAMERTAPNNLGLAVEQGGWAQALRAQGRLRKAESRARRASEAARRIGGPGHPLVAINTGFLADVLQDQGRLAEADSAYDAAIAVLAAAPPTDPNASALRVAQAHLWVELGRSEEAEARLRELQAAAEDALGRGHPVERRAAEALIELYEGQGRSDEAQPFR